MSEETIEELKNTEGIDPEVYFKELKSKIQEQSNENIDDLTELTEVLLVDAYNIGQDALVHNLVTILDALAKERSLITMGFTRYVEKDDITLYSEKVSKKVIKFVELARYTRTVPTDIAKKVSQLKKQKIFDEYFIVFTDYTGETTKQVAKAERRKDPIIFGVFCNDIYTVDRFYFIGDWVDEYCDLTLEKLMTDMAKAGHKNVVKTIPTKVDIKEGRKLAAEYAKRHAVTVDSIFSPRRSLFGRLIDAIFNK